MAIQRERLNRKNASGEYDTIHLETQADLVLMASDPSKNVEQVLGETVAIAKGGTGATTAAAGLYNLMAGLAEMTAEELAEDDLLCVLDVDANSAKKIALSVVGIGGSGTPEEPVTNPNWPSKSDLVVGNVINWAGHDWIVSHIAVTDQDISNIKAVEAYLTLKELDSIVEFGYGNELDTTCSRWQSRTFTSEQLSCLKEITAGVTSGKVFVATYDQMNGGFSYFNSNAQRIVSNYGSIGDVGGGDAYYYWTSTEDDGLEASYVESDTGELNKGRAKWLQAGFRPSVCIDLTLYNQ